MNVTYQLPQITPVNKRWQLPTGNRCMVTLVNHRMSYFPLPSPNLRSGNTFVFKPYICRREQSGHSSSIRFNGSFAARPKSEENPEIIFSPDKERFVFGKKPIR
jgi:hypothetical protein